MSRKISNQDYSPTDTSDLRSRLLAIRAASRKAASLKKAVLTHSREWAYLLSQLQPTTLNPVYVQWKLCWDGKPMVAQLSLSTDPDAPGFVAPCPAAIASLKPSRAASGRSRKRTTKKASPTSRTTSST